MSINLKEYIGKIKDLEVSLYQQKIWCNELRKKIYQLAHPYQHQMITPLRKTWSERVGNLFLYIGKGIRRAVIIGVIGFVICVIIFLFDGIFEWGIDEFLEESMGSIIVRCSIIGSVLITIIEVVLNWFEFQSNVDNIKHQNQQKMIQNQNNVNIAQKQLMLVRPELKKAEELYNQTLQLLERYYDQGIIFKKYQSIVPICSFYEYLDSDRCTRLEGYEGAYNLYETELRMNVIIDRLDIIIDNLNQIKQNQSVIAYSVQESNRQVNDMSSSLQISLQKLDSMEENAALTAYYSKVNALTSAGILWIESNKKE